MKKHTHLACLHHIRISALTLFFFSYSSTASADFFHYNNFLIGERAVGLGGAFTAIADDSSGVVYNPAGMAFAQSSDFSGSANAYYWKEATYKNTIGPNDFVEESQGSVPSFFGGLQQAPFLGAGGAFGFAIYSPDADSKSQNNSIVYPELGVENFHRVINAQASTTYFAAGIARRFGSRFSAGIGLNFMSLNELTQEYQDSTLPANTQGLVLTPEADTRGAIYIENTQNSRFLYEMMALEPVFGFQLALLDRLILGFSARASFILSQSLDLSLDTSSYLRFADATPLRQEDIANESSEGWLTQRERGIRVSKRTPTSATSGLGKGTLRVEEPFGGWPSEARLGLAWFASTRFLMASDFSYRMAPKEGELSTLNTEDVWNAHLGMEFYATPSLPVRLGLFTNHDARPDIDPKKRNQPDHIDYYGASLTISWATEGNQIGIGYVGQYGIGESQKLSNSFDVQDVEAQLSSVVIALSNTL